MVESVTPPGAVSRPQLFLTLRQRVEEGYYAPGTWLPAERALAQEFGVDRSAIRGALQQLEEGGLIVRQPGRRPYVRHIDKPASRRAGSSLLRTVLAIFPQHPNYPASHALLHGINATLQSQEAPYRLQVFDTYGVDDNVVLSLEKQALASAIDENIAGVVLWHMGGVDTLPQLQQLQDTGIPLVLVDRYPPDFVCDFVGADNQSGVEEAISYLYQLGHRRIAHLTTDEDTTAVRLRRRAYRDAMLSYGIVPELDWIFVVPHGLRPEVAPAVAHFLGLAEPPTAVFTMNDSLAHYFITDAEARGRQVPGDISVIGFDDLEKYSPRPALLTTMHQPFDKMGRRAADLLLRQLTQTSIASQARQHVLLPVPLVIRSTCRSL